MIQSDKPLILVEKPKIFVEKLEVYPDYIGRKNTVAVCKFVYLDDNGQIVKRDEKVLKGKEWNEFQEDFDKWSMLYNLKVENGYAITLDSEYEFINVIEENEECKEPELGSAV